jgi:RHS repeat-associated protein
MKSPLIKWSFGILTLSIILFLSGCIHDVPSTRPDRAPSPQFAGIEITSDKETYPEGEKAHFNVRIGTLPPHPLYWLGQQYWGWPSPSTKKRKVIATFPDPSTEVDLKPKRYGSFSYTTPPLNPQDQNTLTIYVYRSNEEKIEKLSRKRSSLKKKVEYLKRLKKGLKGPHQSHIEDRLISYEKEIERIDKEIEALKHPTLIAKASKTIHVEPLPPPITRRSGYVHGVVYDAKTGLPLQGALIRAKGIPGTVISNEEGRFSYPTKDEKRYLFTITKHNYTYAQRWAEVRPDRDTSIDPVYLIPLDHEVTYITPHGGTARNSTGTLELIFPEGAVDHQIPIRATWCEKAEYLPAPLPPNSIFTYAASFYPGDLHFNKPVTLRVKNTLNFPPGTPIPIGFYNREKGKWEAAGMGEVLEDGEWSEYTIHRFSWYDCNVARRIREGCVAPELRSNDTESNIDPDKECMGEGSRIGIKTGHLYIEHTLPSIRSLGIQRTITLTYSSRTAYPQILFDTMTYTNRISSEWAPTSGFLLKVEGIRREVKFKPEEGLSRQRYLFDARNARGKTLKTGIYPYKIELSNDFNVEFATAEFFGGAPQWAIDIIAPTLYPKITHVEGNILINNQISSPIGAGWGIEELQRLYPQDGGILLIEGDGTTLFFEKENGVYVPPRGEYSTITQNEDGTYTRRMKDGVRHIFNLKGLHTQTIDRNNNTTTYTYDEDGRLISIEDPVGQITTFSYSGWHLSSITDPAGRTTRLIHDERGNLIEIINPDGTTKRFTYDGRHLLTERIDERGNRTSYIYNRYGRIVEVHSPDHYLLKDGVLLRDRTINRFRPQDTQGLLNDLPEGVGSEDNPAPVIRPDVVRYEVEEGCCGNGKRTGRTDRFGAVIEETDALGRTTHIERDFDSNPTRITRPNGAITQMSYDEKGNLLKVVDPIGATTSFSYDPTFNQVTSITDPNGNNTQIEYDDRGNPIRIIDPLGNITSMEYDDRGLLISTTDPLGNKTTFSYDSKGNLISTIDPLGNRTTLEYDDYGNITSSIDPLGRRTYFEYDVMNRLLRVIDPAGGTTHYGYDEAGNLTSIIDANGNRTHFTYNELNQLTKIINPLGGEKSFYYDIRGNLVRTIDQKNQVIDYEYDLAGQLIKKKTPDNLYTYSYDKVGNLTSLIDNDSNLSFSYDLGGRLRSVGGPQGTLTYGYDPAGNRTRMYFLEKRLLYSYNEMNNLTQIRSLKEIASFAYDERDLRTRVTLGNRIKVNYTHDPSGRITSIHARNPSSIKIDRIEPGSGIQGKRLTLRIYGSGFKEGAVVEFMWRGGGDWMEGIFVLETRYPSSNQIEVDIWIEPFAPPGLYSVRVRNPDWEEAFLDGGFYVETPFLSIQSIHPSSVPRAERDLSISVFGSRLTPDLLFSFSGEGITIKESRYISSTRVDLLIDTAVDAPLGPRDLVVRDPSTGEEFILEDGLEITRGFDVTSITPSYSYRGVKDLSIRIEGWGFEEGIDVQFSKDGITVKKVRFIDSQELEVIVGIPPFATPGKRDITLINSDGETSTLEDAFEVKKPIKLDLRLDYTYDKAGNRTRMDEVRYGEMFLQHQYTYDRLNRLIHATHPDLIESFSYDSVGNRLPGVYDAANRLLEDDEFTYEYDENGNLIKKVEKTTEKVTTYQYDAENQLIRVDLPDGTYATYRYDGLGRRIEKNVNGKITRYVYDNEDIILEYDGEGNLIAEYIHGPGIDEPLMMERDGEIYYFIADALGSIKALVDGEGGVRQMYEYDAFGGIRVLDEEGAPIQIEDAIPNPYTFTGREYDPETGLYYYRARYYDPGLGRFLQEDPAFQVEMIPSLKIGALNYGEEVSSVYIKRLHHLLNRPQDLQFYIYCLNNPLIFIDPYGVSWWKTLWKALKCMLDALFPIPVICTTEVLKETYKVAPDIIERQYYQEEALIQAGLKEPPNRFEEAYKKYVKGEK